MIFFCLRLSKRRPRGQLSSSPDFEAGKAGGQAQSSDRLGKNVGPGGVCGGRPSPVLSTGFQKPLLWGSELEGLF